MLRVSSLAPKFAFLTENKRNDSMYILCRPAVMIPFTCLDKNEGHSEIGSFQEKVIMLILYNLGENANILTG